MELSGSEVTDADLAHLAGLTALETLSLYSTPITGAGLAHLTGLTALKHLTLMVTPISCARRMKPSVCAGLCHFSDVKQMKAVRC